MNVLMNPRHIEISQQIQALHATLSALFMQPEGGKSIPLSEAKEIATALLPDLKGLVKETELNIERHA